MEPTFDAGLSETLAKLERLERSEWWRWTTVLLISLALTFGLFSLSYPNIRPDIVSVNQLDQALWGLLGMVLLFDVFAFYQQFKISRLRRNLSSQIGMLSTLEALRPPNPVEEIQRFNRRKVPRFYLDQRLKVSFSDGSHQRAVYGRTRDISETGLGSVIAEPLEPGTRVSLEFPMEFQEKALRMEATVCYRRGFHQGFEFLAPSPDALDIIRRACLHAKTV